jgi:membrane fusion protein, multidrug efflux system
VGTVNSRYLNTVSNTITIRVRFSITEGEYLDFRKRVPDRTRVDWSVDMVLSDGSVHPSKGKINLANREIDPTTGTLTLEATFPNPDKLIRPGQFARVRFVIETRKDAMLVPLRAVSELQGTYMVYVINNENKVETKMVQASQRYGEYWIIDSGLELTDRVALIGNIMLKVNTLVTPVPVKPDSTTL